MRSLFLKILFWFWGALVLIVLGLALISGLFRTPSPAWRPGEIHLVFGMEAADIYERAGKSALEQYLNKHAQIAKRASFFFDLQGNDLTGHTVPDDIRAFIVRNNYQTAQMRRGNIEFFAVPITSATGQKYFFATERPLPPEGLIISSPLGFALQILIIILLAGVGCYVLARYLTAPIVKLREATRKFASGDLSARVGNAKDAHGDEIVQLSHDFDQMAERIESLINGQHRLLGDISHELRSPLARLNLALGVARRRAGDVAATAHDRIEREAERLNELIEQLLRLTELESGESRVKSEPINLAELIAEIAADANFEAKSKNRSVAIVHSQECVMTGDERLLSSAIENVVRNAIRYTAEATAVEISLSRPNDESQFPILLTVRDHGPGVPDEALAQLFQPFYRVDNSRDRYSGGVGLGLSITDRAIRLHHGTVKASNATAGGLLIQFQLPVCQHPAGSISL